MTSKGTKKRALIVDDVMECRKILEEIVTSVSDLEVVEAATGETAIERLEEESFDVVLTDTNMPSVCGVELLRWCQQQMPHVSVVIFFSGSSKYPSLTSEHLAQMGAVSVLSKPYEVPEVVAALELAIQRRQNLN